MINGLEFKAKRVSQNANANDQRDFQDDMKTTPQLEENKTHRYIHRATDKSSGPTSRTLSLGITDMDPMREISFRTSDQAWMPPSISR
jgi:hypothetical protein